MFERPTEGERAVLVHVNFGQEDVQEELREFKDLVTSAGVESLHTVTGARAAPDPKYFIGRGKAEEIKSLVEFDQVDVALINHAISPSQERNLERLLQCRVLDRTGLILAIFAQRARSFEGKLQVELAQLKHLSTRLVRGWTHLERQKGGIGLRGPGETQLETDRRLVGNRIKQIQRRLEKVQRQREQGRRARTRAEIPTVSLVGYTNTGKSTLFNQLTGAEVYSADQLFATLDPTLRRLELPESDPVVLADTVGFIRHLPHDLVAAFRSTLQETVEADLLLHVIDANNPDRLECAYHVNEVLREIGADQMPQIEVFNKIDLTSDTEPRVEFDADGTPRRLWVSALQDRGLDLLRQTLADWFRNEVVVKQLVLPPQAGRLRAKLFDVSRIIEEEVAENGDCMLNVKLDRRDFEQLQKQEGLKAEMIV